MKRRLFLSSGLAAATLGFPHVSLAHDDIIPDYNIPPEYVPQQVKLANGYPAGEIHVDPTQYALFWTLPEGKAIRYVVGIGRPGLYEPGEFYVAARKEWPYWVPTAAMIEREPEKYEPLADGLNGGLKNPLGARALYLFQPNRGDTFLRIHGTNDPTTLAKRVSNGCARLLNSHLIDLYDRVPIGTKVILHQVA